MKIGIIGAGPIGGILAANLINTGNEVFVIGLLVFEFGV